MKRVIATVLAVAAVVSGCSSDPEEKPASPAEAGKLRVLAGSELADLKPVLDKAAQVTGVRVEFTFSGTIEGSETIASGKADGRYDAVWFSANRYPQAIPDAARRLGAQAKIMTSPVVLGLAKSKATELGWVDKPVSWSDIAKAAAEKRFSYGMTDPSASNSGFSALVGVASALAGTGSAISAAEVGAVKPQLKGFFAAQAMSAGSSGWLSEAYQRRATGEDPGAKIDGLINYESVLLSLNAGGKLPEPLALIYPSDGVVTADYPLTALKDAPEHARADHKKLTEYLRTPDVQRDIMSRTHRRPAVPGVELGKDFTAQTLVELPFPATEQAFDALLMAYFDEIRRPARTVYVLDVSGSMEGERIEKLRGALVGLTGANNDLVGRYRRFHGREEVTFIPFSGEPQQPVTFTLPETNQQAELDRIKQTAEGLETEGGTAIYSSLERAYQHLGAQPDDGRFTSIVLMTDGENNSGLDHAGFQRAQQQRSGRLKGVPVFPVLFGEGNKGEMEDVAKRTGGKVFDARDTDLQKVFREIRGYQ
ncbi:VWA domain-containing protein [Actinokineospora globicatena]|uniref:VWA domain-containing protein n=1 Tax=Actinokineospora globicatena TaxID=103729 RepID=UPI0020A41C2F|nr:VWA domain-containing protein [Actinokineospora globicatena]MCP2300877.1 Ca-activated chloride channel family protein [Actinokineospora globicatena]GLW77497.1 VWA domain-containing protein [Actinokineospora globicatena]GLW84331.1 VWA domain-containing protein [Actinokineospora globicatena]